MAARGPLYSHLPVAADQVRPPGQWFCILVPGKSARPSAQPALPLSDATTCPARVASHLWNDRGWQWFAKLRWMERRAVVRGEAQFGVRRA